MPEDFTDSSDYGSDFTPDEEELLNELLAQVATPDATVQRATEKLGDLQPPTAVRDIEDYAEAPCARVPKVLGKEKPGLPWKRRSRWLPSQRVGPTSPSSRDITGTTIVEHPSSTEGRPRERERDAAREQQWIKAGKRQLNGQGGVEDARPPVERFRRPPNKAFSVTDFISPAWCELQYWYTLTKYGRKKSTPAMARGSVVHKTLEDEIYTTVPVEITTKEDAWGLRVWNVIQGLRTLREFGITRELEVWGVVDGEVVNGIIDQLSYESPDPDFEATAAYYYEGLESSRVAMPEYQMSLTDYLLSPEYGGKKLSDLAQTQEPAPEDISVPDLPSEVYDVPRVYLTDVKTKGRGSIPTVKSTSFRPTVLQLSLYYHLLNRLAISDDVTIELLANRYDFDPEQPFSDAFVSEVGGLNERFFDALSSQGFDPDYVPTPEDALQSPSRSSTSNIQPASQDSTSILLAHNNLASLWALMKDQLRLTFLTPAAAHSISSSIPAMSQPSTLEAYPTVLSPLLTARFLSSAPTEEVETRLLGSRSFFFDPTNLTSYLSDQMEWWRGGRDPRGVEIMDAWKCRICEFRDECTWRQEREWAMASRRRNKVSAMDI
ncbi:hypothetical protein ASPZODRAFT_13113 [Penicilliopsis zonata CBS 506.65]|uniref:Exonuclease V n=1 Tax=Penicilliopsis zonata CBS 506.65 TaxID=1073090 RepID=A0A1L9SS33_9EURO|nr:hypothetical protein ASPZODRAFT_13113 [Penicilliopsis zonata CBS 506.65]OJJ50010.1 hypothetical protein ASPZODRAFT_13113 [Penicilliopsis zonata CBS 506.65]